MKNSPNDPEPKGSRSASSRTSSPSTGARLRKSLSARSKPSDAPSALKRSAKGKAKLDHEALLAQQLEDAGAPAAERQYVFVPGRKYRADFAWPGHSLLVEVQGGIWQRGGGGHSHPMHIVKDIERTQLAAGHGWRMCPVTTDQVRKGEAVPIIERALRAGVESATRWKLLGVGDEQG